MDEMNSETINAMLLLGLYTPILLKIATAEQLLCIS